jgi:hypothetical protein
MRVVIVRGPHKGATILDHEGGEFIGFVERDTRSALERVADRFRRRSDPAPRKTLYRIFSKAVAGDDRADVYAAAWCIDHDTFADRCPHAPPTNKRRWVRFGPRLNQTQLEAGSPGTRESKWHLLKNPRQVEEPWLAACELIVYGPLVEEFHSELLTPTNAPMCRNCKRIAGVVEDLTGGAKVFG